MARSALAFLTFLPSLVPCDDLNRWLHAIAFLHTHDLPCPACAYSLRGNTTGRCPECGHDFDPIALAAAAPRDAPMLATVFFGIILASVLGANALAVFIFQHRDVRSESVGLEAIIIIALVVSLSTWRAAEREATNTDLLNAQASFDLLFCILSLGLYRIPRARLWSPALVILITLFHLIYAVLAK